MCQQHWHQVFLWVVHCCSLLLATLYMACHCCFWSQADASSCAEIQRRYADHLYSKHDYDGAMTQYVSTIGFLEPSHVIRKFLDAQRIHNLTSYLEQLHEQVTLNSQTISSVVSLSCLAALA